MRESTNNAKKKRSVKKCSECGICKTVCPIYLSALTEYQSPRGKAILLKQDKQDGVLFECTLCKACQEVCPLNIDFDFIEVRKNLISKGISPETDKEMVENIKKYGTPFGNIEKGKKPKKLYCC
jgi:Fe-S oxidoreductase